MLSIVVNDTVGEYFYEGTCLCGIQSFSFNPKNLFLKLLKLAKVLAAKVGQTLRICLQIFEKCLIIQIVLTPQKNVTLWYSTCL